MVAFIDPMFLRSRLLNLSTLSLPIEPASSVFCNLLVSTLLSDLRSCTAPHSCFAIEHDFLIDIRFRESESVFELFYRQQEGVWIRGYWNVDGGGNEAGFVFMRFADVNQEEIRRWLGGYFFDL